MAGKWLLGGAWWRTGRRLGTSDGIRRSWPEGAFTAMDDELYTGREGVLMALAERAPGPRDQNGGLELTRAERAYLWRRRHGIGQTEMARRAGVHPDTWGERERGQAGRLGGLPGGLERLKPTPWEQALIVRRRKGWTQPRLAKKMRVTRHAVMLWERGEGNWSRLVNFWAEEGY